MGEQVWPIVQKLAVAQWQRDREQHDDERSRPRQPTVFGPACSSLESQVGTGAQCRSASQTPNEGEVLLLALVGRHGICSPLASCVQAPLERLEPG